MAATMQRTFSVPQPVIWWSRRTLARLGVETLLLGWPSTAAAQTGEPASTQDKQTNPSTNDDAASDETQTSDAASSSDSPEAASTSDVAGGAPSDGAQADAAGGAPSDGAQNDAGPKTTDDAVDATVAPQPGDPPQVRMCPCEKKPPAPEPDKAAKKREQERLRQLSEPELTHETKVAVEMRPYKPWEEAEDTTSDWLRTTSGEWLKGNLKLLREGDITFESDKFDTQTLSLDDVADIHAPNPFIFVLDDKRVYRGTFELADGKVAVATAAGIKSFAVSRLMTIVQEKKREIQHWAFKLTAGAVLRRGNTQRVDYSAYSKLSREDAYQRHTLEYNGAYSIVKSNRNTNKHRGNFNWNVFISPKYFLTPIFAEAVYDEFQNIALRGVISTGGGAHVVDVKDFSLDVQVAMGYLRTKYISVEPPNTGIEDGALVSPQFAVDWNITEHLEFVGTWISAIVVTSPSQSFHHGTARLSVEITDIIDIDLSALYDRNESPKQKNDGTIPYKDDISLTLNLGIELD